jgi:hypothetical protein
MGSYDICNLKYFSPLGTPSVNILIKWLDAPNSILWETACPNISQTDKGFLFWF